MVILSTWCGDNGDARKGENRNFCAGWSGCEEPPAGGKSEPDSRRFLRQINSKNNSQLPIFLPVQEPFWSCDMAEGVETGGTAPVDTSSTVDFDAESRTETKPTS